MAYTSAIKVFQNMQRVERAEESFSSVSGGDTLDLANDYIIKNAFPNQSKTVILTVDGNVQDPADYTVDFDTSSVSYNGTDSGEATVEYKYGPFSDTAVQASIDAVVEHIDDYTNSTYNGVGTVTDELYDGAREDVQVYPFRLRPVQSVSKVAVNKPDAGSGNPNYVTLDEGLGNDYVDYKQIGIRFLDGGESPVSEPENLQVTYEYGYSELPADLEQAATEMVVDDLVRGTVSGAMVDGRDNFDPQTVDVNVASYQSVLDRYRLERYENIVNLAEEGTIS